MIFHNKIVHPCTIICTNVVARSVLAYFIEFQLKFLYNKLFKFIILILFIFPCLLFATPSVRIKDIANIQGIRENQLLGIGLVTGLAGQGDASTSVLLQRTLSNFINSFGIAIEESEIRSKNCAVVMVSAEIPGFVRPGDRIDLSVSSIGDAQSLEGGILLQTNLKAANGEDYAIAQGKIIVPGSDGSIQTVGTIIDGAIIEREVISQFVSEGRIYLILKNPDFVTANSVGTAIEEAYEEIVVNTIDASQIEIFIPSERLDNIVSFISEIEQLTITPESSGKVVIDSQSGVIIIGENVRISKVAVSYQSMNITVGTSMFGQEENPNHFVIEDTTSVNDFVDTLTTFGLETETIIEILKAIERAGALYGKLVIF